MKIVKLIFFLIFIVGKSQSQELFVFTEPASNMPAKSLGIRGSNWLMFEETSNSINYHFIPELMWGANKKLMLHVEGFLSNRNQTFSLEGGGIYLKYRFFSRDDVFKHFRMAAFGRVSANNGDIHQEEIEINGHNTGYEGGLIATQLLHKLALSITASYEQALDNFNNNKFPKNYSNNALNYSFSVGRLILPKVYTSYKQVNMNLMVELLGQTQLQNGKTFIDIAPSIQFILNSQLRIDIAYKQQLYSDILRSAPNGILFRLEYLLFNVF
ncbi:MAG: hypothetical protein H0W84_00835 [Bacteroidetes bacterium]|nr:hypothetical protein [Bacteroidota bacterium]